jgi:hypothetical protein
MNAEVAAKHPLASRTQAKTKVHISSVLFFLLLSQLYHSQIDAFVGLVRFSGLRRAEPLPCVRCVGEAVEILSSVERK